MLRKQAIRSQTAVTSAAALSVILLALGMMPARAQAFADLKLALVEYSKADIEPRKACEALGKFKSKELVQVAATTVPAASGAPAHCRVTGLIAPEIAFEVSLPSKWNGRFYMIGNGGHAGEALDDAGRVAQRYSSASHSRRRTPATMLARNQVEPS